MKNSVLFLFLAATSLVWTACQMSEIEPAASVRAEADPSGDGISGGHVEFTACFEDAPEGSRTSLNGKTVSWVAGDLLDVMVDGSGDAGRNQSTISGYDFRLGYRYKTESSGAVVGFEPYMTTVPTSSVYYGLYPYVSDAEHSQGIIHTWISQYQMGKDGDFPVRRNATDIIAPFSVAKTISKETPFVFRNMSALLKFTIPASMAGKITKIRVASPFKEYLSGDIYIDASTDEPSVGYFGDKFTDATVVGTSKKDYVNLFPGEPDAGENEAPTTDTFQAGEYTLAVVPGVFNNGLDVEFTTHDGQTWRRVKRAGRMTLSRNTIYDMGEVAFPGNVTISGAAGVTSLPYVFSFFHDQNTNETPKYVTYTKFTSSPSSDSYLSGAKAELSGIVSTANTAADNSGASLRLNATYSAAALPTFNTNCWKENLCRDNVNVAGLAVNSHFGGGLSFESGAFLSVPMQTALPSAFRVFFGLSASGAWCCKNFALYYTSDPDSWWCHAGDVAIDKARAGGANYYFYAVDVPSSGVSVAPGQMFYLKIVPYGTAVVGGGASAGVGNTSQAVNFHSAIAIAPIATGSTATPAGNVVLWQPFDNLTDGAPIWYDGTSYREPLAALSNFPGTAFASWSSVQKKGAAGSATDEFTANEYVCARPGYVQISTAPSDVTNGTSIVNHTGALTTPALGVTGNVRLSFKAMRYFNPANARFTSTNKGESGCNDVIHGESASFWIGVTGGGRIGSILRDGTNSGDIEISDTGWQTAHPECSSWVKFYIHNYDSWHNYNITLNDVTADTKIFFTGYPASDGAKDWFTRFFVDDILVTK
ncbi:MAG: hypothetical protein J6T35_05420 [Bacteroidales bacterium]|nr:hypothetical protein [Bacteroidales bacterium]